MDEYPVNYFNIQNDDAHVEIKSVKTAKTW